MDGATVAEKVMFVEAPHTTGISNFLIELPFTGPIGWLAYHKDTDNWSVHLCPPERRIPTQNRFARREDAEKWVRSFARRDFT